MARGAVTLMAALLLVIGVAWTGVSPRAAASANPVGTGVRIQVKNFAFEPAAITIKVGQKLTWTNDDVVPHTATADHNVWDSGQVAPGHSFTVTVIRPGMYEYTCLNHPFMHAKVIAVK